MGTKERDLGFYTEMLAKEMFLVPLYKSNGKAKESSAVFTEAEFYIALHWVFMRRQPMNDLKYQQYLDVCNYFQFDRTWRKELKKRIFYYLKHLSFPEVIEKLKYALGGRTAL